MLSTVSALGVKKIKVKKKKEKVIVLKPFIQIEYYAYMSGVDKFD